MIVNIVKSDNRKTARNLLLDGSRLLLGFLIIFRVSNESHYIIDDFLVKIGSRIYHPDYNRIPRV
ncbi:hypothetical protein D3C75_1315790 [compost metagenome]